MLSVQPGLNPGLVVLLSSIAGLLAFALSNALYVLHMRHRRLASKLTSPWAMRIRTTIAVTVVAALIIALAAAIPGPTLVDGKGWLSGDNLFSVTSRAGFAASYPNTDREVKKGDPILQLARDAGPEEIAEATNRRALLAQELEFVRLESLRVDPLLLAGQASEKDQLDDLLKRRRSLVEKKVAKLPEVERELESTRNELERAVATQSRRDELRARVASLTREQKLLRALANDDSQAERKVGGDEALQKIDGSIARARAALQAAWQAIEQDKVRAKRQQDYRIRQVELQIAELDQLLNARVGALDVRAPWDGVVGFREPSPAGARLSNRPLVVLYKPDSVSVRIRVSADQLESTGQVEIDMQALIPEAAGSIFAGKIIQRVRRPDGSGELHIAADPPEAAIRELAAGSSVPVQVAIHRLNPLAAPGISWVWLLAGALVFGFVVSETRLWWLRRHAGSPRTSLLRMDWGGDPNEFVEYVVGVGIVARRLSLAVSSVEGRDDRRMRREPVTIVGASKALGASSTDLDVTVVAANRVQPAGSTDRTLTRVR